MSLQQRRDLAKPVACALAVALGLLANYLFTGSLVSRHEDVGSGWSLRHSTAVVALAAAVFAGWYAFGREDPSGDVLGLKSKTSAKKIRLSWFIPALLVYGSACGLYVWGGETASVRWLWCGSIVGLFLPVLGHLKALSGGTIKFWEFALVLLLTIVAFALRYSDLTDLPYHVDNDVSIMGLFSRHLVEMSDFRWIGMAPTEHPYSEHQFQALSMRLFGRDHFGLVMMSVLAGTATVPVIYLLGRLCFNRWVGLIAAALLSADYVHIHFSRLVFGPIATFFIALAGLCIVHGIRKVNALSFAAGGASIGCAMLGYYSGRVAPVLYAAVFVWWLIQRSTQRRVPAGYWLLALLGLLVVFGPNLAFSISQLSGMNGRGNTVILWTEPAWRYALEQYGANASVGKVLGEQALRTFLTPFYFPDTSTIFYLRRPMLGVVAGIGLLLGVGYCVRRYRNPFSALPVFWVGLTFLLGGVLTSNPPFWPHLNIAVPGLALLSAVGLERLVRVAGEALPLRMYPVVPFILVSALGISGVQNWTVYHSFAAKHASGDVHATRQVQRLSKDYRVFLVSSNLSWTQETFAFLAPHLEGHQLPASELEARLVPPTKPTAFLVYEDVDKSVLTRLMTKFPHAIRQVYYDGWGWPVFTMVRVFPPGYVESPQLVARTVNTWWTAPGGKYLVLAALLMCSLGGVLLRRELHPPQVAAA